MSYLIKEVDIDIETGKSTIVSVTQVDGDYRKGDDMLVRLLAESYLKEYRENQQKN